MKKILIGFIGLMGLLGCGQTPTEVTKVAQQPVLYPDYIGVTIPVDIAPLNFSVVGEDIDKVDVQVTGSKGGALHTHGDYADFDMEEWHALTEQNKGGELTVTVCVRKEGKWLQYQDFKIYVSPYLLEEWGVTYRRIAPGYEVYSHMGLYQRNLSTFEETAILENTQIPGQCINCHMSNRTDPSHFVFHVRGDHGATMIQTDGKREWLKAKNDLLGGSMVYPYWHPSGNYCAFSTNQTRQGFHVIAKERIEVVDLSSDIFVYHPATHEILTDSLIQTKDWSENTPVFSPDGKTLYYMTCKKQEDPNRYKEEQYNLCKIAFDPEKGTFGDHVDTLFNAVAMGKSLTWPRPSYDGRYILFTLIDYGYFSIWHEESEQWLLDLQSGEARPLDEINSPRADSYHNWNVNSRWIVFTSRRDDGLYSRLYLASIDEQGRATKPMMLPQRNPRKYYEDSMYSFNTPDFTKRKVEFDVREASFEIMSDKRIETKVR
ncbi:MAG: PD40 domain-containing protein [Prevotella sp.]|nr:PD40 domain-containing protein [Prevotella sp.]